MIAGGFLLVLASQIDLSGYTGGITIGKSGATDSLYVRVVKAWPFSFTSSVATDGKKGYAATKEGIYVVSDKTSEPTLLETPYGAKGVRFHNAAVFAMLEGREGIAIFKGTKQGTYVSDAQCLDMAFSGNVGFIAAGEDGMIVVSLADPLFPEDMAYFDTPGYAQGIDAAGKYVAIADGEDGVFLVDVSTPRSPKGVSHYDTDGVASGVCIYGKYVFVADGKNGLVILDFSRDNPLVGHFQTPGFAKAVEVVGKYAYVADGTGGLRILDVSNVAEPVEKAYYDTAGFTGDVAVAPPLVYVADGQFGVIIMENTLLKYFK